MGKAVLFAAIASVSFLMFCSGCGPVDPPPPPPADVFKVLVPNGGNQFTVGSTMTITWTEPATTGGVMIEISVDDGMNWMLLTATSRVQPGVKTFSITIPATMLDDQGQPVPMASNQCRVKIYDYLDNTMNDQSDAVFTIN